MEGEGEGDDEQIRVDLTRIQPHVEQVCFVVNIYSPNRSFRQVARPYCRVLDDALGHELCRSAAVFRMHSPDFSMRTGKR